VVIFSDMFDVGYDQAALFDALQHLRYNKHEVILFHVVDKNQELDFNFTNRPYRFIDIENGDEVKVQPAEVRDAYASAVSTYTDNLKLKCGQYKIDFIEADINKGFEQVLLPYLLKIERMH